MSLLVSDADVRRSLDFIELADALEAALKAQSERAAVVPARMNLEYEDVWMRVMPAMVPSANVMGVKVFNGLAGTNPRYLVLLYSMENGSLLSAVDACYLTAARTAASSAVAARHLAPTGPVRLAVIGSGLEASTHCQAMAAVSDIAEVRVFSPHEGRRRAFADRMHQALGVPVSACDSAEDAIAGVHHVLVATNTGPSMSVACRGDWLKPGQHITSIGSTNLNLRELDLEAFRRADVIVLDADPQQMAEESGDLVEFTASGGTLDAPHIQTLQDLVSGKTPGRQSAEQLSLYKSVGTALQDIVAAELAYRRVVEAGLGTTVTDLCLEKASSATEPAGSIPAQ